MQLVDLNLASRQFKNETLPWLLFVLGVVAIAFVSWWNVSTYAQARVEMADLLDREQTIERRLGDLRVRQARTFAEIDRSNLNTVLQRTEAANEVIRWKSFSWTRLFNVLQEVQPHDVQMISINPVFHADAGRGRRDGIDPELVPISVEGISKSLEDYLEFQTNLQLDSRFDSVKPDGWSTDEVSGESVFGMLFLYDPRIDTDAERDLPEEASVAAAAEPATQDGQEEKAAVVATAAVDQDGASVDSSSQDQLPVAVDSESLASRPQKKIRRKRAGKGERQKTRPSPLPAGSIDGEPKSVKSFGEGPDETAAVPSAGNDGGRP